MSRKKFAIITFDPDRIDQLSWQGEGNSFAWNIWRGMAGYTYPKERGIINITLMDQLPAKPHMTTGNNGSLQTSCDKNGLSATTTLRTF